MTTEEQRQKKREYEKANRERIREVKRKYRKNHKKEIRDNHVRYYAENREKLLKQKSEYYQRNKKDRQKKLNQNRKDRRRVDKNYAISLRLRSHLFRAFDEYTKTGKKGFSDSYGVDYSKILEHLKPFPEDLSKYHIDHIKPLCSFDLTNKEEIKKAFAPENHRWLLAKDNLKKVSIDLKMSLRLSRK